MKFNITLSNLRTKNAVIFSSYHFRDADLDELPEDVAAGIREILAESERIDNENDARNNSTQADA